MCEYLASVLGLKSGMYKQKEASKKLSLVTAHTSPSLSSSQSSSSVCSLSKSTAVSSALDVKPVVSVLKPVHAPLHFSNVLSSALDVKPVSSALNSMPAPLHFNSIPVSTPISCSLFSIPISSASDSTRVSSVLDSTPIPSTLEMLSVLSTPASSESLSGISQNSSTVSSTLNSVFISSALDSKLTVVSSSMVCIPSTLISTSTPLTSDRSSITSVIPSETLQSLTVSKSISSILTPEPMSSTCSPTSISSLLGSEPISSTVGSSSISCILASEPAPSCHNGKTILASVPCGPEFTEKSSFDELPNRRQVKRPLDIDEDTRMEMSPKRVEREERGNEEELNHAKCGISLNSEARGSCDLSAISVVPYNKKTDENDSVDSVSRVLDGLSSYSLPAQISETILNPNHVGVSISSVTSSVVCTTQGTNSSVTSLSTPHFGMSLSAGHCDSTTVISTTLTMSNTAPRVTHTSPTTSSLSLDIPHHFASHNTNSTISSCMPLSTIDTSALIPTSTASQVNGMEQVNSLQQVNAMQQITNMSQMNSMLHASTMQQDNTIHQMPLGDLDITADDLPRLLSEGTGLVVGGGGDGGDTCDAPKLLDTSGDTTDLSEMLFKLQEATVGITQGQDSHLGPPGYSHQIMTSPQQMNINSNQMMASSQHINMNSNQLMTSSQQVNITSSQLLTSSHQINVSSNPLITSSQHNQLNTSSTPQINMNSNLLTSSHINSHLVASQSLSTQSDLAIGPQGYSTVGPTASPHPVPNLSIKIGSTEASSEPSMPLLTFTGALKSTSDFHSTPSSGSSNFSNPSSSHSSEFHRTSDTTSDFHNTLANNHSDFHNTPSSSSSHFCDTHTSVNKPTTSTDCEMPVLHQSSDPGQTVNMDPSTTRLACDGERLNISLTDSEFEDLLKR